MECEPSWRLNISDICRDFYNLSKTYQSNQSSISNLEISAIYNDFSDEPIVIDDQSNQTTITDYYNSYC